MKLLQTFSLDLAYRTPDADSIKLMETLAQRLNVDICFTIERKKANKKPHLHAYCIVHPSTLEKVLKELFGGSSFKILPCYDLKGWQEYITKENELKMAQPIKPIEHIQPIEPIKPIKPMKKNLKSSMSEYIKLLMVHPRTLETKEKMSKMLQVIKEEQKLKQPIYDEVIKQNNILAKKMNDENRSNKNLKRIIYYSVNYKEL